MNREMKRMMKRQGAMEADGSSPRMSAQEVAARRSAARPSSQKRMTVAEYAGEVRDELKKVNWPTRQETITYSTLVFVLLVVLGGIIFGLNFGVERSVTHLLQP